jgi:hypothetical protein
MTSSGSSSATLHALLHAPVVRDELPAHPHVRFVRPLVQSLDARFTGGTRARLP